MRQTNRDTANIAGDLLAEIQSAAQEESERCLTLEHSSILDHKHEDSPATEASEFDSSQLSAAVHTAYKCLGRDALLNQIFDILDDIEGKVEGSNE